MGENKEGVNNWIVELAEIVDKMDSTFVSGENIDIIVTLPADKFQMLESYFRDVDRGSNKKIVSISGVNFTFVLKR